MKYWNKILLVLALSLFSSVSAAAVVPYYCLEVKDDPNSRLAREYVIVWELNDEEAKITIGYSRRIWMEVMYNKHHLDLSGRSHSLIIEQPNEDGVIEGELQHIRGVMVTRKIKLVCTQDAKIGR